MCIICHGKKFGFDETFNRKQRVYTVKKKQNLQYLITCHLLTFSIAFVVKSITINANYAILYKKTSTSTVKILRKSDLSQC